MSNSQYDDTNRGALFKNSRKTKDSHPNMTGRINVEGKEYWISAWTKTDRSGNRFQSLSVSPVETDNRSNGNRTSGRDQADDHDDFDDDIPM